MFVIRPIDESVRWHVNLADCTVEHAQSVLEQLEDDPSVPDNLILVAGGGGSRLRRLLRRA